MAASDGSGKQHGRSVILCPGIVYTPTGIEAYFEEVTCVLAGGEDEALEVAAALMEKHETIVPPETRPAYGALMAADRPLSAQEDNMIEDSMARRMPEQTAASCRVVRSVELYQGKQGPT